MMTTASYPTAAFQASPPSASYQQQPNAAEYGYGNGNGNGNYNYYPTTATTTAATPGTTVGYGVSAQNTYNNPYQQTAQQPNTHPYGGAVPQPLAEVADGDTSNSKQKTKRRWSFYNGRSKNEGNDGGAETAPGDPSGACYDHNSNNHHQQKKDSPAGRRWSLYGRSKNESKDESSSETASGGNNDQLVVYTVPPSETAGSRSSNNQQQPPNPGFRPTEVHPDKQAMKNDRKAKMAGAATTGAIIGGVLSGPAWPVGAVAGAAIATYAGKVTARAGERRQQRKWEQKTFNAYLAKGEAGVQSESVAFA